MDCYAYVSFDTRMTDCAFSDRARFFLVLTSYLSYVNSPWAKSEIFGFIPISGAEFFLARIGV